MNARSPCKVAASAAALAVSVPDSPVWPEVEVRNLVQDLSNDQVIPCVHIKTARNSGSVCSDVIAKIEGA
jgi:hypothetical protein